MLNVIDDQQLVERAAGAGAHLVASLRDLKQHQPALADIREQGLLIGVELATPAGQPDAGLAERVVNGLRDRGILIGRTGPSHNVLKIPPPLVFTEEHAQILVDGVALVGRVRR